MSDYILRAIPAEVHEAVRVKATRHGRTLRWLLISAMTDWVTGRYTPTDPPDWTDKPRQSTAVKRHRKSPPNGRFAKTHNG